MKESYRKGVATILTPRHARADRKAALEALGIGAYVGWVSRSSELRNRRNQGADGVKQYGRQHRVARKRECNRPCGVEDPTHA